MSFAPFTQLFDGYDPTAPHQVGPLRFAWDPITKGASYEQTLRVLASFWQQEAMDSVGPEGGNLVSESIPRHVGAGLLEWDRKYLFLPPSRTVAESISYPVQIVVTNTGIKSLVEIPLTTTAWMVYDYWHTSDPTIIPILHAFRLTSVATNIFYYVGTPPADGATSIIAQDSAVRQLGGLFYERKTPWIAWPITPQLTS